MNWREALQDHNPRLRIAVLGDGEDSVLAGLALAAGVKALAMDIEVAHFECAPEEMGDCVDHLVSCGFRGVSVCNPLKAEAAKLAPQFFIVKHGLGVANALTIGAEIYAQNTEVAAFTGKIQELRPGTALIMGSGRAARSAVLSLFECGWRIKVWNRNVIRSRPFATAFETLGKVELMSSPDPSGCSLIVNATTIGAKAGEQPPVKWSGAGARLVAIDFVYRGVATEFLRSAMQRGFKTVDGRELLAEQAALALEWWLAQPVPRAPMYQAVGLPSAAFPGSD